MVVNGSTFLATHPNYKKVRPKGRRGRKPVAIDKPGKAPTSKASWFKTSNRKTWAHVPSKQISEQVFQAASNLAIAQGHRLDSVTCDDVATAFKSLYDVVGVPFKTVKRDGVSTYPVVVVHFRNQSKPSVIRVDSVREVAQLLI